MGGRIADDLMRTRPDLRVVLGAHSKRPLSPEWAPNAEIVPFSMEAPETMMQALAGVTDVIHLATLDESAMLADPEWAWRVKAMGSFELLKACRAQGVKRLIYFSTYHVYGSGAKSPISEISPTRASHPYSATHRATEDMIQFFADHHGLQTAVFRLSNGYGYAMDSDIKRWNLVFNDLCRQAVLTGKIVLKSNGEQSRDFISLGDVARAVQHFLFNIPDNWGDGLYNLGGECSLTILAAAHRVAEVYKKIYHTPLHSIVVNEADKTPNRGSVIYDISKLKATGFRLAGNMDEEIEKTLNLCESLKQ